MWITCKDALQRKCYLNLDEVVAIFYSDDSTNFYLKDGGSIMVRGDVTPQIKIMTEAKVLKQGE